MKKKRRVSQPVEDLRKRAENCVRQASNDFQNFADGDFLKLIQELRTHHIELEIQNEELCRTQAELERSRQKYFDLFDFAPVGYFTFDGQGLISEVNLTGCKLLAAKRRDLLSTRFNHFVAPDYQDLFYFHCRNALKSETKQTCALKLIKRDGSPFYAQLESVAVGSGDDRLKQLRTALTDITERKQAEEVLQREQEELGKIVKNRTAELETINEELHQKVVECRLTEAALRESENKYSTLVEDALIGVYIIKDGKIEFANDKFASIYGYAKNELIGMESVKLVHPQDRAQVKEMREKRLKGGKVPAEYEIRGLKKNGDTIWVMRSLSLINFQDGPAISGIVADMTERKKAEEALRESGKEMRILSNQLLSAEEKERKRIAGEM
ncbi:MAG: PAS domain S-box protein, partial [Deltaproteobacteria bacterium]|nr:PAS domain S-box protein [Deltaproteobacteria bacterium]